MAKADIHSAMVDTVTAATLARYFGVTARAIGDLVRRKVIERQGSHFDLQDCTRRAMTHYRNLAQGRGGEVDVGRAAAHQRARLAKAQAELVETKGKKLRGELVDATEVEAEWSGVLAVPSRCQQRLPHLTAHDVSEINREVRDVLAQIGAG
jgi:terminase small subunit / prophage DNA-packing protein